MVLIGHVAVDHEIQLVVAVRVDAYGLVVPIGYMGPDGAAEGVDFLRGG